MERAITILRPKADSRATEAGNIERAPSVDVTGKEAGGAHRYWCLCALSTAAISVDLRVGARARRLIGHSPARPIATPIDMKGKFTVVGERQEMVGNSAAICQGISSLFR